jgi:hypothetical protein
LPIRDTAGWQPALRRSGGRRYGRLAACATAAGGAIGRHGGANLFGARSIAPREGSQASQLAEQCSALRPCSARRREWQGASWVGWASFIEASRATGENAWNAAWEPGCSQLGGKFLSLLAETRSPKEI